MNNFETMQLILQKIKEYDRIMLFRHVRTDGDCVGATKGMKALLRASFPEKEIYIVDGQHSDFLSFLGEDTDNPDESLFADALGIILDTGSEDRIFNKKYALCRETVKIDHHIEREPYGDTRWVEDERSSTCEMVATFYNTFRDELVLTEEAATYLYTGMVTDSGRFRFRDVSGDTLRAAAVLLDRGIDTDTLYAHLYMQDFDYFKFKSEISRKIKITENGVAYLHITKSIQEKYNLSREEASNVVSLMDSIKGSLIWVAFIDTMDEGDKTIRVRLRSRFVTVNEIAEKYRGGGHACACGATLYSRKEIAALLADADARLKEYKENNEGWL